MQNSPTFWGEDEINHRNGTYDRSFTLKGIGEVQVNVPRDRQYEKEISRYLSLLFLTAISTRTLSMVSWRLIRRQISPAEVSAANVEIAAAVEKWRMGDLSKKAIKYLFIDVVNFRMRVGRKVEIIPVLVAIGVAEKGHKLVLQLQSGDKESASSWRGFFKDLKRWGLNASKVTL